jgi:glycine C-acetyltransferase
MNPTLEHYIREMAARSSSTSSRVLESAQGARVCVDGEWKISLCSNNYLGLANHQAVKEAAARALAQYGAGMAAARSLSGSTPVHVALERELAAFKATEASLLLNSGFSTNSGVIPALVGRDDAVFSDAINHGSIVDGCRLSGATKFIYPHGDLMSLEQGLKESMASRKRMIVVDAVFSMDGDLAPIPEIVELCEKYDAILMIDEAHATGVLGENGRGAAEHFHVERKVDVIMGTLGKAIGSIGGYVAAERPLIEHLARNARSYLLTTSLPASCVAAALAGLQILRHEPQLRERLWRNTNFYRDALQQLGFNTMKSKTPIVPILVGDDDLARRFQARLYEEGVYASKIGMPYVPRGTARLRTIVSSLHTEEDLGEAIAAIEKVGREVRII